MQTDLLVTGSGGQLGRAVLRAAQARGLAATGWDRARLPVEDWQAVSGALAEVRPRFVIHAGAWTDVDGCEREPWRAVLANGAGTANVASACSREGVGLVYVSTDFVFDGAADSPYREDDPTGPLSAYGRSKLLGEQAVASLAQDGFYTVRTSWVFGPGGKNFPAAILARARQGMPLKVVVDQLGRPTYADDLAEALLDLAESGAPGGVYHASNEGQCSWRQFAIDVLAAAGMGDVPVDSQTGAELGRPAVRPAYSVLDCGKLARVRGRALPDYQDAVARYLEAESQ